MSGRQVALIAIVVGYNKDTKPLLRWKHKQSVCVGMQLLNVQKSDGAKCATGNNKRCQ